MVCQNVVPFSTVTDLCDPWATGKQAVERQVGYFSDLFLLNATEFVVEVYRARAFLKELRTLF